MPFYFVTMEIKPAGPQLPTDRLAKIVREAILPSIEALIPLQMQGKLLTGGYLVGERSMIFVFEADSEEELREVLGGLPLSGAATTDIKQMRSIGELRTVEEF